MRTIAFVAPLATAAVLVVIGMLPATASAQVRIESTAASGMTIRDSEDATGRDIQLSLYREPDGNLRWWVTVKKFGPQLVLQTGRNCFDDFRNLVQPFTAGVVCDRLAPGVAVEMFGGDDHLVMATYDGALPISDRLTMNLGSGNDSAEAAGGNDVLDGGAGNDTLYPDVGADSVNGGAGDDTIFLATPARDETDQVNGGTGRDIASYTDPRPGHTRLSPVRIIEADLETLAGEKDTNENDVLRSIENYGGGAGADIMTGVLSSNDSDYNGGLGDDQLFGTSGNNRLRGGAGKDKLSGKAGVDILDAKHGEGSVAQADSPIDCGTATGDFAITDLVDALPVGCENFERSDARSSPHVRMRFARVVRVTRGRISVRLSCPRTWRPRCAGTLELRLGGARGPRRRYSVRPGRSRRVSVRAGALERRVRRRTTAQLVSFERGRVKGRKTTLRRIVVSRRAATG